MINYVKWAVIKRLPFYKYVNQQYNVKKIKPFNPLRWKHGVKYFIGEKDGKKVFIKTPGFIDTIKREKISLVEAKTRSVFLSKHIPSLISENIDDELLIEEKIEGIRLDKIKKWNNDISKKRSN